MCTEVLIKGEIAENQGDLARLVGGDLVIRDGYDGYAPSICLCPVDIEATAAKHGYKVKLGWTDRCPVDCEFVPC
jgi:hypothetical protein